MKKNAMRILIIFLIIVMMPFPAFAVNEDYIPIDIDGYYDDWEDKPFTEVYPGHNPPQSKINYVSLFRDEDNVYVHVTFAYKNNQDITNMIIELFTNMGNENYFLVPDFFWPMDLQSEPDMTLDESTDLSPLEQAPAIEEGTGTEEPETAPGESAEPTETPEPAPEAVPETVPEAETPDQGGTTDTTTPDESGGTTEQNILAGHAVQSYILVADKDKTDPAADSATADTDPTTPKTDEKTNNGQGNGPGNTDNTVTEPGTGGTTTVIPDEQTNNGQENGSENNDGQGNGAENNDQGNGTETSVTDPGDLLDILDPGNLIDLDDVLDQFTSDGAIDSSVPDNADNLNSNLNLKKHGWYGTWGFSVWDGLFPVGSGYYTRTEGEPDELELYIPLSSIAHHHHDGITEISMRIKKLGPQYIMCTGVSTGAYVGIAAGAGIALLSVGAYTFKRKRPFALGKGK